MLRALFRSLRTQAARSMLVQRLQQTYARLPMQLQPQPPAPSQQEWCPTWVGQRLRRCGSCLERAAAWAPAELAQPAAGTPSGAGAAVVGGASHPPAACRPPGCACARVSEPHCRCRSAWLGLDSLGRSPPGCACARASGLAPGAAVPGLGWAVGYSGGVPKQAGCRRMRRHSCGLRRARWLASAGSRAAGPAGGRHLVGEHEADGGGVVALHQLHDAVGHGAPAGVVAPAGQIFLRWLAHLCSQALTRLARAAGTGMQCLALVSAHVPSSSSFLQTSPAERGMRDPGHACPWRCAEADAAGLPGLEYAVTLATMGPASRWLPPAEQSQHAHNPTPGL